METVALHVFLHIPIKIINAPLKEMAQMLQSIPVAMSLHARLVVNHAN